MTCVELLIHHLFLEEPASAPWNAAQAFPAMDNLMVKFVVCEINSMVKHNAGVSGAHLEDFKLKAKARIWP